MQPGNQSTVVYKKLKPEFALFCGGALGDADVAQKMFEDKTLKTKNLQKWRTLPGSIVPFTLHEERGSCTGCTFIYTAELALSKEYLQVRRKKPHSLSNSYLCVAEPLKILNGKQPYHR